MNDGNWWEMQTMSLSYPGWQMLIRNKNKIRSTKAKNSSLPLWGWEEQRTSSPFSQLHHHPTRTTAVHAGMGIWEPQVTPYGQQWSKPASCSADFQTSSNLTQQHEGDFHQQGNRPTTWSRKRNYCNFGAFYQFQSRKVSVGFCDEVLNPYTDIWMLVKSFLSPLRHRD